MPSAIVTPSTNAYFSSGHFIGFLDWLLTEASPSNGTANSFVLSGNFQGNNASAQITGYGFTYNGNSLTGGNVTGISATVGGQFQGTISTDVSLSILLPIIQSDQSGVNTHAIEDYLLGFGWTYHGTDAADIVPAGSFVGDGVLFNIREADILRLKGGNDDVFTGDGNDLIEGGQGNDKVDGGSGLDTSAYSGARAQYVIDRQSIVTVQDSVNNRDGSDQLTNVERLQFSDLSVGFDINGSAGQGYRMFKAAFDREPDEAGLGFWISALDKGQGDLVWVAANFIDSDEFRATYGAPGTISNQQFVTLLYGNVLDREPDDQGLAFWITEMNQGMSRERVLAHFSESSENQVNVIGVIQNGVEFVAWTG